MELTVTELKKLGVSLYEEFDLIDVESKKVFKRCRIVTYKPIPTVPYSILRREPVKSHLKNYLIEEYADDLKKWMPLDGALEDLVKGKYAIQGILIHA